MENFELLHIVLYSKDWYAKEHEQDIWADLRVIFTLDGYMGEHMTKNDMVSILLINCERLNMRAFDLMNFANGIDKRNSYKTGYKYQDMPFQNEGTNYPEWDSQEAIVRYCLSELRFASSKKYPKLPFTDYVRGLPKSNDITIATLNKFFGRKKEEV